VAQTAILILYTVLSFGLLIWSGITTKLDPIHHRLLSPLYVPMLVLLLTGISRLIERMCDILVHTPDE
jgi:membrane-associated phospholipid phosphatase